MILVAFGANLPGRHGAPTQTFQAALSALEDNGVHVVQTSSLWETSPVGTPDEQPWYVNAVLEVETDLMPRALLELLLSVETQFGRVRTFKNAAKSIDLDLIAYHDEIIREGETLIVPHPRMDGRAFVLLPMQEIASDWVHPASGKNLSDLIAVLPEDQEARILQEEAV